MSRLTFAPEVVPTLHERRRASERPPWTPASVLRNGVGRRCGDRKHAPVAGPPHPNRARSPPVLFRPRHQGVFIRVAHERVARSRRGQADERRGRPAPHRAIHSPIAARGGGARLPAPVGQWGGQRRGYRSNTYRGPLHAAGRGLEAHGASSVGARPGGSRSPGGGVLRGHIRVYNTTIGLTPRPPRPWTRPIHPMGHAGRLSHRKCRLQRPSTPRSRIGRFSQKPHLRLLN